MLRCTSLIGLFACGCLIYLAFELTFESQVAMGAGPISLYGNCLDSSSRCPAEFGCGEWVMPKSKDVWAGFCQEKHGQCLSQCTASLKSGPMYGAWMQRSNCGGCAGGGYTASNCVAGENYGQPNEMPQYTTPLSRPVPIAPAAVPTPTPKPSYMTEPAFPDPAAPSLNNNRSDLPRSIFSSSPSQDNSPSQNK